MNSNDDKFLSLGSIHNRLKTVVRLKTLSGRESQTDEQVKCDGKIGDTGYSR